MKKSIATLILLLISWSIINAQEASYIINYDFHLNIYNYVDGYHYKSALYTNKDKTLFTYNAVDLEGENGFRKFVTYRSGSINGASYSRSFDRIGQQYYYDKSTRTNVYRELLGEQYPVKIIEKDLKFDWKITNETKNVGTYTCTKATLKNFYGRDYIAWFASEIPINSGPYKFRDLPGLILEVYDTNKNLHITVTTIKESQTPITIEVPEEKEIITHKRFLEENYELYHTYIENQKAYNATGKVARKLYPNPYSSIEYNSKQVLLLDETFQIPPPE